MLVEALFKRTVSFQSDAKHLRKWRTYNGALLSESSGASSAGGAVMRKALQAKEFTLKTDSGERGNDYMPYPQVSLLSGCLHAARFSRVSWPHIFCVALFVLLVWVADNDAEMAGRVLPPPWIIPLPVENSAATTIPALSSSVLSEEALQQLRSSLSALALQLSKALSVDRADLRFVDPDSSQGRQLSARAENTLRQLVEIQKMQRALYLLETPSASCSHLLFSSLRHQFAVVLPLTISTGSALRAGHTLSFTFNHSRLIDSGLALESANDIRIYHQPCADGPPVQVHRVIDSVGKRRATVHFPVVDPLPADTLVDDRYVIVFGNPSADEALCDPRVVFPLYEDFSQDGSFNRSWTRQSGSWSVSNGYLRGVIPTNSSSKVPAALYRGGQSWRNVEIEMDIAAYNATFLPEVFLRDQQPSSSATSWFVQFHPVHSTSTLRHLAGGRPSSEFHSTPLPSPWSSAWNRIKFLLTGERITQWFGDDQVWEKKSLSTSSVAESGTIGLGCSAGEEGECGVRFDNILVRHAVERPPSLTVLGGCQAEAEIRSFLGERQTVPANSCRQIFELSKHAGVETARTGLYWINTPSGAARVFCDMQAGGFTLIGKVNGNTGDITRQWLVSNSNTEQLRSPLLLPGQVASIDATVLATLHASEMVVCNGDNHAGRGSKWLRWSLPEGRGPAFFWRRSVGRAVVQAAAMQAVLVRAWDGSSQTCYHNRYGIGPHHGGFPATLHTADGQLVAGDLCISVGTSPAITASDSDGFARPDQGFDSPTDQADWPNTDVATGRSSLSIWVR